LARQRRGQAGDGSLLSSNFDPRELETIYNFHYPLRLCANWQDQWSSLDANNGRNNYFINHMDAFAYKELSQPNRYRNHAYLGVFI